MLLTYIQSGVSGFSFFCMYPLIFPSYNNTHSPQHIHKYILNNHMFCHSQTKVYLRRNAEERAAAAGVNLVAPKSLVAQLPAPGSKITKDELEDVSPKSLILFKDSIDGQKLPG